MDMIFLKNYYFSWLLDLKLDEWEYQEQEPMVTNYDRSVMLKDIIALLLHKVVYDYMIVLYR